MTTKRLLKISTGPILQIGGLIEAMDKNDAFIGCTKMIIVDGNYKLPTDWYKKGYKKNGTVIGACQILDHCNPNPCEHSGICKQELDGFSCGCTNTGYDGFVCRTRK